MAKNEELKAEINGIKAELESPSSDQQIQQLSTEMKLLQDELKETKDNLAAVQAGDKSVIDVIAAQESFQKPSFFKTLINKIIASIKNIF